jgi:hypothetical protein
MPAQVEVLLFAIRSAIRINEQVRRGFADMVRAEEIHLPLPDFPAAPTVETVRTYYETQGARYLAGDRPLKALFDAWQTLDEKRTREFILRYQEHWALDESAAVPAGSVLQADLGWDDYRALLTVRQWRRGAETTPSLLQRAAGTLIEIAVDYHLQVPGALNTSTSSGRIVRAFLESIDDIRFAEEAREAISVRLVDSLFVSVLETLRDHPAIAADGERGRELVKRVAGDLARTAQALVEEAPGQGARERVEAFAGMLFPSLLRSSAETLIADPERFLGVKRPAQVALVSGLGKALLASAGDDGLRVEEVFSPATLDAAVKAALVAVARFPELLGAEGEKAGKLVAAVAGALAEQAGRVAPELLPQLVRLVLEKSAEHLDALLPEGDKDRPERHLLVAALKPVLAALARPAPAGAAWKPALRGEDVLAVAEAAIAEVVENPRWVVDAAGRRSELLGETVGSVLDALRAQAGPRLRRDTASAIVVAAVQAVGRRLELSAKDAQGRRVVALVVAAVVGKVHGEDAPAEAAWLFARDEALQRLVALTMEEIARAGAREELVALVQAFLDDAVARIRGGEPWSWDELSRLLRERLAG